MTLVAAAIAPAAGARRRARFCCKTEMGTNVFGDADCGRQDLVFVGHRSATRPWSGDAAIEVLFGVLTNAAFLSPLLALLRRRRTADVASCVGLIVASSCYHWCDVFDSTLLGMNGGNWHRLDNVFAIASFVALVPLLMGRVGGGGGGGGGDRGPTRDEVDAVRWGGLFLGLFFQELNPWDVLCTAAPVLAAFAYYFYWRRRRGGAPARCAPAAGGPRRTFSPLHEILSVDGGRD